MHLANWDLSGHLDRVKDEYENDAPFAMWLGVVGSKGMTLLFILRRPRYVSLLSDEASNLTGGTYATDGGMDDLLKRKLEVKGIERNCELLRWVSRGRDDHHPSSLRC